MNRTKNCFFLRMTVFFLIVLLAGQGSVSAEDTVDGADACPFAVTKGEHPAEAGTEYYWDGEARDLTVLADGLTVSMADGVSSADARIDLPPFSEAPVTLTLDGVNLIGTRAMICAYAPDCELILRGENRVAGLSEDEPAFFGGLGLVLRGDGSLILSVPDTSRKLNGAGLFTEKPVTEGLAVRGSASEDEAAGTVFFPDDGTFSYATSDGSVCKTLTFSVGKTNSRHHYPVGAAVGFLAAGGIGVFFLVKRMKDKKSDWRSE
ncbi:MAG: hypothetical protein KBS76_04040 [Ruminococcus sp.]|nr:hypothetical protein [Candidatus Apopatosoma intestinale]